MFGRWIGGIQVIYGRHVLGPGVVANHGESTSHPPLDARLQGVVPAHPRRRYCINAARVLWVGNQQARMRDYVAFKVRARQEPREWIGYRLIQEREVFLITRGEGRQIFSWQGVEVHARWHLRKRHALASHIGGIQDKLAWQLALQPE